MIAGTSKESATAKRQRASELLVAGAHSCPQIARIVGLSRSRVARLAREMGIKAPKFLSKGWKIVFLQCTACDRTFCRKESQYRSDRRRWPDADLVCSTCFARPHRAWTDSQLSLLEEMHGTATNAEIGLAIGKTAADVATKLNQLRLLRVKAWNTGEIAYLRSHRGILTQREMADALGRTKDAIGSAMHKYRLSDPKNVLTDDELRLCRWYYEMGFSDGAIGSLIGRNYAIVYRWRKKHQLDGNGYTDHSLRSMLKSRYGYTGDLAALSMCDGCGGVLRHARRRIRTERNPRRFCSHQCKGAYQARQHAADMCSRCGVGWEGNSATAFRRGLCSRCYQHMKRFDFDSDLAAMHELTLKLLRATGGIGKGYRTDLHGELHSVGQTTKH